MLKYITTLALCCCIHISVHAQTDCAKPSIPDVFTPNGDGFNDTWIIGCLADFADNELVVYNRWGQQVYKAYDYNNDWTGTNETDKKPLDAGTYVYMFKAITAAGEQTFTGTVTIVQ